MTNKDKQLVQQPIIIPVPTTIHVTISLPTYIPKGSIHQPSDGREPRDSPGRSSHGGDLHGGPPFNPPIGSFG
jgi:hypothetical protein